MHQLRLIWQLWIDCDFLAALPSKNEILAMSPKAGMNAMKLSTDTNQAKESREGKGHGNPGTLDYDT